MRARSALVLLLVLTGCVGRPPGDSFSLQVAAKSPVAALQRINRAGAQCWPRSPDADLNTLHLVPELDTRTGLPRLLLLERGNAEGLPVLVIEAAGSPVTVSTYGPLAGTPTGRRVNTDITRWSTGPLACRNGD